MACGCSTHGKPPSWHGINTSISPIWRTCKFHWGSRQTALQLAVIYSKAIPEIQHGTQKSAYTCFICWSFMLKLSLLLVTSPCWRLASPCYWLNLKLTPQIQMCMSCTYQIYPSQSWLKGIWRKSLYWKVCGLKKQWSSCKLSQHLRMDHSTWHPGFHTKIAWIRGCSSPQNMV